MDRTKLIDTLAELTFEELAQMCVMLVSIMVVVVLIWRRNVFQSKAYNAMKRYMDKQLSLSSEQELLADQIDVMEHCNTYYLPQAEFSEGRVKSMEQSYLTGLEQDSSKPGTISHKLSHPIEDKDEEEERLTNEKQMKF